MPGTEEQISHLATADLRPLDDGRSTLRLAGRWTTGADLPSAEAIADALHEAGGTTLAFDAEAIDAWDSRLVTWVQRLSNRLASRGGVVDPKGLPAGVRALMDLAQRTPDRGGEHQEEEEPGPLARLGEVTYDFLYQAGRLITFVGEVALAFGRLLTGRSRFRRSDLYLFIQETGADALPIVGLISLLVGLILAFIGSLQLSMFGAQIYIANLGGIAMVREMGAMMAAIIMAGRTGAAFSAQLGTMQVNEEIDAFRTLGIDPVDFLVLPRILALILMMPLLCIYADMLGILGGMLVGVALFDISALQYVEQTRSAIDFADIAVGISKSLVFGVLVGVAGCMHGIQCGRSASAVGEAATSAVVTSIVAIVVADAVMTLITNALGI